MKILLPIFLFCTHIGYAQGVFSNDLSSALQKIIQDYPHRFKNLKGEQISEGVANTRFQSRIEIPGRPCYLMPSSTRYGEYSWNCLLFESPDFKASSDQFKQAFEQIKNMIIKIEGHKPCIVNGHFEAPAPNKEVTIITFDLVPETAGLSKCKIELVMQHEGSWKVLLRINDSSVDADYSAQR